MRPLALPKSCGLARTGGSTTDVSCEECILRKTRHGGSQNCKQVVLVGFKTISGKLGFNRHKISCSATNKGSWRLIVHDSIPFQECDNHWVEWYVECKLHKTEHVLLSAHLCPRGSAWRYCNITHCPCPTQLSLVPLKTNGMLKSASDSSGSLCCLPEKTQHISTHVLRIGWSPILYLVSHGLKGAAECSTVNLRWGKCQPYCSSIQESLVGALVAAFLVLHSLNDKFQALQGRVSIGHTVERLAEFNQLSRGRFGQ